VVFIKLCASITMFRDQYNLLNIYPHNSLLFINTYSYHSLPLIDIYRRPLQTLKNSLDQNKLLKIHSIKPKKYHSLFKID